MKKLHLILPVVASVAVVLGTVAAIAPAALWIAAHPWFRPIVAVGAALFVCGILALLLRLIYFALRGWGFLK